MRGVDAERDPDHDAERQRDADGPRRDARRSGERTCTSPASPAPTQGRRCREQRQRQRLAKNCADVAARRTQPCESDLAVRSVRS